MDDEHSGRRRNRTTTGSTTARSQAVERLKAIRKGESRPACQIRLENPIYDTVEEDEYKDLVSKRREEFGNFIVTGDDAGDGYLDDGEEEDWTKSTAPLSSNDDGEGGEESEFGKLKKKRKKEKGNANEKKKKVLANSAALSAAAASLMGKQKISAMFTSNVLKKRGDDKSNRGNLASDSVVEDGNVAGLKHEEKHEFVVESDGSLPFYIRDAHEEIYGANAGTSYLFGKCSGTLSGQKEGQGAILAVNL